MDGLKKDFATSQQTDIQSIRASDAQNLLDVGHFPPGSMGPKVQALIDAVSTINDMKCIICSPGNAVKALRGESGTSIEA